MGNVMAYSGLTTKIRAMQAKLLTQADYETISGFTDVVQVVEFLKTKPAYAVYMDQLELAHLHRGDIEKMLYQSLYNDYTRIFRFAGIDQKKFLKIYWKKYEVSVINYCLRIVFNHYDKPYDLDYKKEFFEKYSKLSIDKLITSTNIDELVDNLRGSEYYEALKPIRFFQKSNSATYISKSICVPSCISTRTSKIPYLSSSYSFLSMVGNSLVSLISSGLTPNNAAIIPFRTFSFLISSLKQKSTVGSMINSSSVRFFCTLVPVLFDIYSPL